MTHRTAVLRLWPLVPLVVCMIACGVGAPPAKPSRVADQTAPKEAAAPLPNKAGQAPDLIPPAIDEPKRKEVEPPAAAQEEPPARPVEPVEKLPPGIYPALAPGSEGEFRKDGGGYHTARIVKVIQDNAAIVRIGRGNDFLLWEFDTKDLADGETIELRGRYKVKGAYDYRGRKYKLVEPLKR